MPEHAPTSRSSVMDLMALRSVTELPVVRRHVLDPEVLRAVAVVDRVGDLTRFNVAEVPELAHVSVPEELLAPDEHGWALGHALSLAVEHGQRLWLSEVSPTQLGRLRAVLGEHLVHIASLDAPEGSGAPEAGGATEDDAVVVAVSPRRLLDEWATGTPAQISYLRTVLEGTDPLRVSRHTLAALREAEVDLVPRAGIVRLLHNPRFLAYATVFIYSSLRALPAVYAPGFRGNPWVLWTIDIVTAVPYTWGIIAMVAGRRRRVRFAGFLVTLITFVAPYVYFFLAGDHGHGHGYPGWVIMVVIGLVLATFLLEGGRWLRDVAVARGLRAPRAG
ncbi:hypothetical protein E4J66_10190 [Actinomyces viscosus]|uniref:Uncharacterized protein n=1 Tax=Actinomyces viscosus TaxID=1656 RepID=A0A3S4V2X4_ACTVI|nr:hypothetical protein [Actinomyces viscosus]TFH51896.1 hypothetical protein E4J66_10190 [Actinomyces viscosus]VEI16654.1 Uncharacterised protein [Actinomyces viscosus]